jgi:PIN domain nuclease of toxin-antitoxin system
VVLLDTHTWAWSLTVDPRLPKRSRSAIENAATRFVSAISFYEIAQKVRLGKWPIMERYIADLPVAAELQGLSAVRVTAEIASIAGLLDWAHRDPFDRILAATALVMGVDFVSADTAFDAVVGLRRIWE